MKKTIIMIFNCIAFLNCLGQDPSISRKTIQDIDSLRRRFHIPGLVLGVATGDQILLLKAMGVRQIDTDDSVRIGDLFHIASLGKGLTSFMAGKLVDEGRIRWDSRFFDCFPEMKETSRKEYLDLELKDLLSMRTTLPGFNDWGAKQIIDGYNALNPKYRFSEYRFARYALTLEPVKMDSGQFYRYTSMGYVLAALMLEKASGITYRQLVEKTNRDLGTHFQIGWPRDFGTDQPSGHLIPSESGWGDGKNLEILNGDRFTDWGEDYLHYLIPSGHHSVAIGDYLKYLQENLRGLKGKDGYLSGTTYDFLFSGAKEYSMGWGNDIVKGNHYYSHSGSAGNFYANAIIVEEPGIVMALMANAGNGETKWGLLQIIRTLEKECIQ